MANELFKDFDFKVLDDRDYKEDAVREDIVTPILKKLGFNPSGENKMVRSKSLIHPFVSIGTKKQKVNIIPDYLLQINGSNKFTLDAKAPTENIKSGENVEQAFSYAIHPEVRSFLYGLCNGREICIYQINKIEPILSIPIPELNKRWEELYRLISPLALTKPELLVFQPDFGLSWLKMGVGKDMEFHFVGAWVNYVGKVDDDTYSVASAIGEGKEGFLASFDFPKEMYPQFIACLTDRVKNDVIVALKRQPYSIHFTKETSFELVIHARFGDTVISNNNEQYLPLKVVAFESWPVMKTTTA